MFALTAVALWLVWPAFEPGRIVNLDAPRHLLRSTVMAEQFLPSGHVDGWSPWWYLGAQLFLFQSYGYFFLIGASSLLLEPCFSIGEVFKVWYVLPLVLLPGATAWMARRLGVSPAGAVVAGLASLTFSSHLGYGVRGLFGIGLLLQAAGVVGFALVWPALLRLLCARERSLWPVVLGVTAMLVVHFITGAYALAVSGCVAAGLALSRREPGPLLRYGLLAFLVLLLAGHSLFGSLEHHGLAGSPVGWGAGRDRIVHFFVGTLFGGRPLAIFGVAAAIWSLWRGELLLRVSAAVFLATAILAGTDAFGWEPRFVRDVLDTLLRPRALPYAALFQAVFVGAAFDLAVRANAAWTGRFSTRGWSSIAPLVVVAGLLAVASPEIVSQRRLVATESSLKKQERRVYVRLVGWLQKKVPPPAVVAVPRELFPLRTLGTRSVISLLNMDTGLFTLGGDQAELTRAASRIKRLDLGRFEGSPTRMASVLRSAAVSHVIISQPEVRRALVGSDDFRLVFDYDEPVRSAPETSRRRERPLGVSVYRLRGGGAWLRGRRVRVGEMHYEPERISWPVTVVRGRNSARVASAVSWHPNWKALVDGSPVATHETLWGRVAFSIPAQAKRVSLVFERSARERLWNILSGLTLASVVLVWMLDARRRRIGRRPDRNV